MQPLPSTANCAPVCACLSMCTICVCVCVCMCVHVWVCVGLCAVVCSLQLVRGSLSPSLRYLQLSSQRLP